MLNLNWNVIAFPKLEVLLIHKGTT